MGMSTIVKYIARKSPYNGYPERIVSPPSPETHVACLHRSWGPRFYAHESLDFTPKLSFRL